MDYGQRRYCGVLMHLTSLPGKYGTGTMGFDSYRFVDFLNHGGQTLWQVLPMCPTGHGNSPYQGLSAFAGNPLLIDFDLLIMEGDLTNEEIGYVPDFPVSQVDFDTLIPWKLEILNRAAHNFFNRNDERIHEFNNFLEENQEWLDDFTLFAALRIAYENKSWKDWDIHLKIRHPEALAEARHRLAVEIREIEYQQFQFFRQWKKLKEYANQKNVYIIGDIPIFVAYDSSDVWVHQEQFFLDDDCNPTVVAGVPPDYFSADGQRWGNPLYKWDVMQSTGYEWWIKRIQASIELYDLFRIDHFRGFEAYWEIPAYEKTARNGRWVPGPAWHFFDAMRNAFGNLPFIAEDLGIITEPVEKLRDDFNLPGMKVLQFAFDGKMDNPYLPHNHEENSIVYTGTHDNDTTNGWWDSCTDKERQTLRNYLGREPQSPAWEFIRLAVSSVSNYCVINFQDLVCLKTEHRMNIPGTVENNWLFRASPDMFHPDLAGTLNELVNTYGRNG